MTSHPRPETAPTGGNRSTRWAKVDYAAVTERDGRTDRRWDEGRGETGTDPPVPVTITILRLSSEKYSLALLGDGGEERRGRRKRGGNGR